MRKVTPLKLSPTSQTTVMVDEAAFRRASEIGARLLSKAPLAIAAHSHAGSIFVELNNGCGFRFPASHTQALANASQADLQQVTIEAAGLSLHWQKLNVQLYVPTLVKGIMGNKQWMRELGSLGGSAATPAKRKAAQSNGRLGGRPRKQTSETKQAIAA